MKLSGKEPPTSIVSNFPKSDGSYMYGHNQPPNAFVYREEGRLCILPVTGGWIAIVDDGHFLEEEAPFAD